MQVVVVVAEEEVVVSTAFTVGTLLNPLYPPYRCPHIPFASIFPLDFD